MKAGFLSLLENLSNKFQTSSYWVQYTLVCWTLRILMNWIYYFTSLLDYLCLGIYIKFTYIYIYISNNIYNVFLRSTEVLHYKYLITSSYVFWFIKKIFLIVFSPFLFSLSKTVSAKDDVLKFSDHIFRVTITLKKI